MTGLHPALDDLIDRLEDDEDEFDEDGHDAAMSQAWPQTRRWVPSRDREKGVDLTGPADS